MGGWLGQTTYSARCARTASGASPTATRQGACGAVWEADPPAEGHVETDNPQSTQPRNSIAKLPPETKRILRNRPEVADPFHAPQLFLGHSVSFLFVLMVQRAQFPVVIAAAQSKSGQTIGTHLAHLHMGTLSLWPVHRAPSKSRHPALQPSPSVHCRTLVSDTVHRFFKGMDCVGHRPPSVRSTDLQAIRGCGF